MATSILLTTLNATYFHCAFGLRYLHANLGRWQSSAKIVEFTIAQNPRDIVENLLSEAPQVVGFGVYVWNARQTLEVVSMLKRVRPDIVVVLGGPEVTYETDQQELCRIADYTIQGEGDFLFREFCDDFFGGKAPPRKTLAGPLPKIEDIVAPYALYSDEDVRHRVVYVEASRGCPYKCEFCLSSLDKVVRSFPLDRFLDDMEMLIRRGVKQFKFVDRTFNLSIPTGIKILRFFLERVSQGLFLHFEMVPDRLPEELREWIAKFPEGSLQFEIGVQTWNPDVAKLVSRRQDYGKVRDNFAFLVDKSTAHLHADLIVGLPGETLDSFAKGFDEVAALRAHEVQVGILKRLRGTPIIRHDAEWEMVYQDSPPYQLLKNKTMSFETMQSMARFAKFWDLVANSGNFKDAMALLHELAGKRETPSLFWQFYDLTAFLSKRHPQSHGIAMLNLVESLWAYLSTRSGEEAARKALIEDYTGRVKRDIPAFLRTEGTLARPPERKLALSTATPKRQRLHQVP